ncbi:MAG: glycosyltransferase [Pseudomonadota bacterium]
MKNTPSNSQSDLARELGRELIGPVVHRWLLGLEQHIAYFDDPDTRFLFCARAGVRIDELYSLYLKGRSREYPGNADIFWVSRLALCKGLYHLIPTQAATVIAREYAHQPIKNALKGLLRHNYDLLAKIDWAAPELDAPASDLGDWLAKGSSNAKLVVEYLSRSSEAFFQNNAELFGGASRVVLIDSGWQGTSQSLLSQAYPEIDWHGLYVGRIPTSCSDWTIFDRVIGILFQADAYQPEKPETAIVLHRHLFETLLEPNGPSIEEIEGGPCDEVAKAQIGSNTNAEVSSDFDSLYLNVRDYIEANAKLGPAEVIARYQVAIPRLACVLAQPTREEAMALYSKDRSADFGKDVEVPVLITRSDVEAEAETASDDQGNPLRFATRDDRIQHSLWPQGQIALEFDGKLRDELQLRVAGLSDDISYFDFETEKSASGVALADAELPKRPLVAVVTRTKNRPILLERAAQSVADQTYTDYLWVIVNDGGDEDVVRDVIEKCAVDRRKIRLVSNAKSLGMEAASNVGIRHVESDYVLIHDDDDALHRDFLKETVDFLESGSGKRYGGVVTGSEYVSEEIRGDDVIIHSRVPYMDWVRNIQLAELMVQNLFAPISFVYRRGLYDEIGGYNPELPVLGDWYFNLEFVMRADIKVLPKTLAYYHHRDRGDSSKSGVYSNSVIGGQSKHEEFASVARNMFARQYAKDNMLAAVALSGYYTQDVRSRIGQRVASSAPPQMSMESVKAAWASYTETDRLWVLTQILDQKANQSPLSFKRIPNVNKQQSLVDLAEFAKRHKIAIKAPNSFDDAAYLAQNPDVAGAVNVGGFTSGFEHYCLNGHLEERGRPGQ